MGKTARNPSKVHAWLVFVCLLISILVTALGLTWVILGHYGWFGLRWLQSFIPITVYGAISLVYFTAFLIVRRKAPDSTFVHVKTDIIIFSILDAAGLAVMINGTVFGFPFYGFVSAVVSYIQVFLILATLLYEALYVRIHFGPKWNYSLRSLASNPDMRLRHSESQVEIRHVGITPLPTTLGAPVLSPGLPSIHHSGTPEGEETLPAYEMVGSSNAAAYFGAEAESTTATTTTTSADGTSRPSTGLGAKTVISSQERRLKQEVLAGLDARSEARSRISEDSTKSEKI